LIVFWKILDGGTSDNTIFSLNSCKISKIIQTIERVVVRVATTGTIELANDHALGLF